MFWEIHLKIVTFEKEKRCVGNITTKGVHVRQVISLDFE